MKTIITGKALDSYITAKLYDACYDACLVFSSVKAESVISSDFVGICNLSKTQAHKRKW